MQHGRVWPIGRPRTSPPGHGCAVVRRSPPCPLYRCRHVALECRFCNQGRAGCLTAPGPLRNAGTSCRRKAARSRAAWGRSRCAVFVSPTTSWFRGWRAGRSAQDAYRHACAGRGRAGDGRDDMRLARGTHHAGVPTPSERCAGSGLAAHRGFHPGAHRRADRCAPGPCGTNRQGRCGGCPSRAAAMAASVGRWRAFRTHILEPQHAPGRHSS